MPVFENKQKLQEVLGELFINLMGDPIVGPKFKKANVVIKYNITEPDGTLWIIPGDDPEKCVIWGTTDTKADVEMTLSGDTCHKFWLKHISMPVALAKGLVKTKGPLPKVLKLLPLLKPAYEMYPEHAKSHGLSIEKE
jgi:hypothetical protein